MIHNSELTVEGRIKAVASFLRLPSLLVRLAKGSDMWLYSFLEEIYLNGDEEKRVECFGDTKESAEKAFYKYWTRNHKENDNDGK